MPNPSRREASRCFAVAIPHDTWGTSLPLYEHPDGRFMSNPRGVKRLAYHAAKDAARVWRARGLDAYVRRINPRWREQ